MQGRKTVVVKRIEHKSAEGRLLSITTTKTVYFGEPPEEVLESSRKGCKLPTHIVISEQLPEDALRRVDSPPSMSRPLSRATEHIGYRTYGNSTVYGDDWSQAGTLLRNSQLVRAPSRLFIFGGVLEGLEAVATRLNALRVKHGLPELLRDERLSRVAREWAAQIILDNHFRGREGTDMNVWMGAPVEAAVADEWNAEMSRRDRNLLECPRLRRFGIGAQWHPRADAFIVVAVYE
ncbi:hypothetical protein QR680_017455 [Steinernema hermaphroditum]|uniref:SCP domain-containing protein n=1 Tax=Steinernema hermaphroditum TaxID=289476 RepID=A0AA39HGT0_9BILA|nr:hypothetical protein QR680_017455 [Steinernema hermaphroditum]